MVLRPINLGEFFSHNKKVYVAMESNPTHVRGKSVPVGNKIGQFRQSSIAFNHGITLNTRGTK